jgi:ATP-binding cassette subfamily B (MDR/TAP) protein 1
MSESDKGEKLSKKGFFFRRKATKPVVEEKAVDSTENTEEVKPAKPEVPTISFTQLFRCVLDLHPSSCCSNLHSYSTKFELFLDAVGLVAAVGAGGAQVDSRTTPFTCLTS